MSQESIRTELRKFIDDKIARGEPTPVNWVTREFMERKGDIEGGDVHFYLTCAEFFIKRLVKECIAKYDSKSGKVEQQIVLPGFAYLQVAYTVQRQGETVLVPLQQVTDVELEARAAEFVESAKGLRHHAREIRDYIAARRNQNVA